MDRRSILGLAAVWCTAPWATAAGSGWEEEFSRFMVDGLRKNGAPGMGVAAVRNGRTLFVRGYGVADMNARRPVTPDTAFSAASASKVVTATAMMMLQEQGAFRLDDPVAPHLDFPLAHPAFPDTPITFRHLLSQTSGISDAGYQEKLAEISAQGGSARDFLAGYLTPNGRWYTPATSYAEQKPGSVAAHSDVSVALLAYLAGRVNADKLDALTQKRLFSPLGMRNTGWSVAALGRAPLAQPYVRAEGALRLQPQAAQGALPASLLRTSPRDFARILEIFSGDGAVDGRRYLQQGTLATFLSPQLGAAEQDSQQALMWTLRERSRLATSTTADSSAALDLDKHVGALAFCNATGNDALRAFQQEAVARLLERARTA